MTPAPGGRHSFVSDDTTFMKKALRLLLAVTFCASPLRAAPPPSILTPEEKSWAQLRDAAEDGLASPRTTELLASFLKKYPQHPKAVNARYILAEQDFQKGRYKESAVALEAFLRDHPDHALSDAAAYRLGEAYYNLGVFNSAFTAWDNLFQRHKQSALVPDALVGQALLRMKVREWGKGDELMKALKSKYPHHLTMVPHRENHGVILYHLGEYTDAVQVLNGIDQEKGAYYRGLSLFALKLYDDAVASLKNVEHAKGGPYVESAAFLKAEGFFQRKNYSVANAEYKAFIQRFPGSGLTPHAHLRIAACALITRDKAEALGAADRILALRQTPGDVAAYAWFVRGAALLDAKSYAEAAQAFARIGDTKVPGLAPAALVRQAWCLKKVGDEQAFSAVLKKTAVDHPASPQMAMVQFLQGAQLFEDKRWEEAGTHLEAGLLRYPYSVLSEASLALMAVAFTQADRKDELLTAANASLKVLSGNYSTASPYWRAQSHFFIGKAYYELKRYKEAIPYLERVVIDYGDHDLAPHAQLLLAWCLSETGDVRKAVETVSALENRKKADPELVVHGRYLRATTFFNLKDYDKAVIHLSDFLKAHPKHALAPEARYLVGMAYHQKRVFGSAVEEWSKLIDEFPDHPLSKEAYLQIGDVYFKAGKYAEAAAFFKKFHLRWPGDAKYAQIAHWQEVQAYFNGKDDESAIKAYPAYMEKYPAADNLADAKKQLEMVYYRRGIDGDPAKLEEFLALYPQSPFAPSARYKLVDLSREQEKWTLVAKHAELFVRDYPKDNLVPHIVLTLGRALEKTGDLDKAVDQYRILMKNFDKSPEAVDGAFQLAMIHFNREQYQEAVGAFQYALAKKLPQDARANLYFNMAICYENLGKLPEAAAAYGDFAKYAKEQERVREALLSAGLLLRRAEDYNGAIPYLNRYLKDPGSPEGALQAVNLLAECHMGLKAVPKAMQTYERLVAMDPADHDLRLAGLAQLAYHYEQTQQFQKALRVYEKIAVSGGKADWTKAAAQRVEYLTQTLNQMP
jgi:TolA-binding protein